MIKTELVALATAAGYEVTERGRVAYERLAEVVSANRAKASEGITEQEYRETIDVLERLATNLGYTATS